MVQIIEEVRFTFEQERLLALSNKQRIEELQGRGFQTVKATGFFTIISSGEYASAVERLHDRAFRLARELQARLRTQRDITATIREDTLSEREIRLKVNVNYEYNREETLEQTRKNLLDFQRDWTSIIRQLVSQLQAIETEFNVDPPNTNEFFIESAMSLTTFLKLDRPKTVLTADEQLFILERRKEQLDISDEERALILERRKKKPITPKPEPVAPKPKPKEPERVGFFTRIARFIRNLF